MSESGNIASSENDHICQVWTAQEDAVKVAVEEAVALFVTFSSIQPRPFKVVLSTRCARYEAPFWNVCRGSVVRCSLLWFPVFPSVRRYGGTESILLAVLHRMPGSPSLASSQISKDHD